MALVAHSWAITLPPTEAPSAESASSFHTAPVAVSISFRREQSMLKAVEPIKHRQSPASEPVVTHTPEKKQPKVTTEPNVESAAETKPLREKYRKRSGHPPQRGTTQSSLTIRQALWLASQNRPNSRAFTQRRWSPNPCSPGHLHRPITPQLLASGASRAQSGWISGSTTKANSVNCQSAKVRESLYWTRPHYRPLPVGSSCLTG